MKARAKCWLKYHGEWVKPGHVFEADEADLAGMTGCAEPCEVPQPDPVAEQTEAPAKPRSRAKKK